MIKRLLLFCLCIFGVTLASARVHYPCISFADLSQNQDSAKQNGMLTAKPLNVDPATGDYVLYDLKSDRYIFYKNQSVARGIPYKVMSREEYQRYRVQTAMQQMLLAKRSEPVSGSGGLANSLIPSLNVGGEGFDRIFGSNTISVIPRGSVELILGIKTNKTDNPVIAEQFRKTSIFDFQSKLQMNVTGMVGDKLKMDINYNTEATFDFENNVKVEYTGTEDEIIQKVEAGNVSLPLPGTLITGSQSLFGFKTQLKFGNLTMTSIFSRQRGQSQSVELKGGAQNQQFELSADSYDANRHFLMGHYFRESYDNALSTFPLIQSGINITKLEVWVTNKTAQFDNARNIVAFLDLGESQRNIYNKAAFTGNAGVVFPANEANNLYSMMNGALLGIRQIDQTSPILSGIGLRQGEDYEKLENARKLSTNEYTFNPKLGYISLNSALNNDEILGVAYEYIQNGKTYKVGELSTDGVEAPKALVVKLLKGTNLTPKLPNWALMMKNIYSIGSYQVNKENFYLDILFEDSKAGTTINYIPEGTIKNKPLLSVLNLDRLNSQGDPYPDGIFDFVNGITVLSEGGKIIFPVLQPFGSYLRAKIGDNSIADRYVYQELYDSSLTKAKQVADKNRFKLFGTFQSSAGSEISLNAMNIPQGSVVVTAGGLKLAENIDYTVDYALGRVRIINQAYLESGVPIKVSLESQALFNIQTKTLVGSHFDYRLSDDFHIGATVLHLSERPLTQKVNFSDEPISNTIWGVNLSYQSKAPWLTSMVQKIPFIETQAPSSILFEAEFAHFIPGHAKAIGKTGNSYIDDFEGAKIPIDLRSWNAWTLASTPQGQPDLFPEGNQTNNLAYGYNRAKLAWYTIDPLFLRNTSYTPSHIARDKAQLSSHWVREIRERELYPEKDEIQGIPNTISVLNLAYYPKEKGPYNYETSTSAVSKGLLSNGELAAPETRWGGIMRSIPISDFEMANVDYIEFWMMDPFVYDQNKKGGELIFNLGNISEDILRDGRKSFEHGLPTTATVTKVDTTVWGRVPIIQSLVNAFDNNAASRQYQDVGIDGLSSNDEQSFFNAYLKNLEMLFGAGSKAYQSALNDPSNDNYHYFRGSDYDEQKLSILDRYKNFNNPEGNSPASNQSGESYSTSATSIPDGEDINRDNTLSDAESYFQYRIPLSPTGLEVGKNFVSDKREVEVDLPIGKSKVAWYQFKVPIAEYEKIIGNIQDFKSVRFIRMLLHGFEDTTILRFARLELVKGEWRRYNFSLLEGQTGNVSQMTNGSMDISTVSVEENSSRTPINYILPPGIDRVIDPSNPQVIRENEQAMQLKVIDLQEGDARATYKTTGYDFRQYKRLKLDVHAEAIPGQPLKNGDLHIFIRLGSDYRNNYYEYEIPLSLTPYGKYSSDRESDREIVWPSSNAFNIALDIFQNIKLKRYDAMRALGSSASTTKIFAMNDGANVVRILGNPSLSNVRTIMIGIRNPSKQDNVTDDGQPKSGIVWVNEMRLNSFNEDGGWAANAHMIAKMADFGVVSLAGSTMKPGFGSLESKLNSRNQSDVYTYDVAGDFELGKFFSEKAGVRIPMHVGYSESIANAKYSPTDQDLLLKTALKYLPNQHAKDSVLMLAQDFTARKSINFTNVGVAPPTAKPSIISPSNFSLTYAYYETYSRNPQMERQLQKNYKGIFSYAYNQTPRYFEPLGKARGRTIQSPYLRLIKDFNVGYKPSQLSFVSEINRNYNEIKVRNLSANSDIQIPSSYAKDFYWNRVYALQWDLTKSLKLTFSANNLARIDEPEGMVDRKRDRSSYQVWKDSVWKNIAMGGRNVHYDHSFNVRYNIPINKIPMFNWVTASASYDGTYDWDAGPMLPAGSSYSIGNTIKNMNQASLMGTLNMVSLYNKVPFLRAINQEFDNPNKKVVLVSKTIKTEKMTLFKGRKRTISHDLEGVDIKVAVYDAKGKPVEAVTQVLPKKKVTIQVAETVKGAVVHITGKVEYRNPLAYLAKGAVRMLMGVRNVSASYTQNEGTILPGYKNNSSWFGTLHTSTGLAPGLAFIMGQQDPDMMDVARAKGWLVDDNNFLQPFVMTHMETFTARVNFEPIKDLIVDITASRSYQKNSSQYGTGSDKSTVLNGSFNISVIGIGSAFEKPTSGNGYHSAAFDRFMANRSTISQRLGADRAQASTNGYDGTPNKGFSDGYGSLSQDVMLPAFLSAYTSLTPSKAGSKTFIRIPFPNWTVRYQGIGKMAVLKPYINSADIEHSYRAVYTIGGYNSNPQYDAQSDGFSYVRNAQNDFISRHEIVNVSISEYFQPLIGVNVGWVNNLQTQARINRSRVVALSLTNNQITEIRNNEWTFSVGYRLDDPIKWIDDQSQKVVPSYLKLDCGLSFNQNQSLIRKIVEGFTQASDGRNTVALKISADYMFKERINVRAFYDRVVNKPLISNTYPTANTSFGFSVRYNIGQ